MIQGPAVRLVMMGKVFQTMDMVLTDKHDLAAQTSKALPLKSGLTVEITALQFRHWLIARALCILWMVGMHLYHLGRDLPNPTVQRLTMRHSGLLAADCIHAQDRGRAPP